MPLRNLSIIILAAIISLACYVRAARNRYVGTLAEAMNIISQEYVDEVDQRKLFEGAMEGMVSQLDEYSGYHPPDEYSQFQDEIGQKFVGIGVLIDYDAEKRELTVDAPLPGTPAFEAGIKAGDVIVSIDGHSTSDLTLTEAIDKIKGRAGTRVRLEVLHEGESTPVKLDVTRASIAVDSVQGDLRGIDGKWTYRLAAHPRLGYIRVKTFGERTVDELRQALASLGENGREVEGLILDLRGNEGGLLDAAVEVCDMFLHEGTIVKTVGRRDYEGEEHEASPGVEVNPKLPLVVLVDRYSASASEIVAACLQDHRRAIIAGQRSWGKGTVQHVIRMEGGRSALRLTVARFVRPSGKNIHKSRDAKDSDPWGVSPDGGDIPLTEAQYERLRRNRSERDALTSSGKLVWPAPQEPGPQTARPSPPSPPPDSDVAETMSPPTGESALSEDPQLRQAVEMLKREAKRKNLPRQA